MTEIAATNPLPGRWEAIVDGDFVVVVLGAALWEGQDIADAVAGDYGGGMLPMLEELMRDPSSGLLGYQAPSPFVTIQYWRSLDHLEAFAHGSNQPHLAVSQGYYRQLAGVHRSGIFHEVFLVRSGEYETVYVNMPPTGLGAATTVSPLPDGQSAADRLAANRTRSAHPSSSTPRNSESNPNSNWA